MSTQHRLTILLCVSALAVPAASAQDSIALTSCSGGDAITPWNDSTAGTGSEQCDNYVVDLRSFTTSWGTRFGVAPLIKSSKSGTTFNNSLISAQAISRLQTRGNDISAESYQYWCGQGFGINNDATINTAGRTISVDCPTNQFGVGFAEFGTTDFAASYNGIISALVSFVPNEPSRMYVRKTVAATNSCDAFSNMSQMGVGAVDEEGRVFFRADGFGVSGGCLGLTSIPAANNHIYCVATASRDCDDLNVISNDYPAGSFDAGATTEVVKNTASLVHSTPNTIPPTIIGMDCFYIGGDFAAGYVRGTSGSITTDSSHLDAGGGVTDQRGTMAYTTETCSAIGGTAGTGAIIARDAGGTAFGMNVFGITGTGAVAGGSPTVLALPASITDNKDLSTTLGPAGTLEHDHYHGAAAFRGGNSQIALGVDQRGNLLAAAQIDHPSDGGTTWPINAIAVARVDCSSGAVSWTLAAYNNGVTGKAIEDGAGNTIGTLVPDSGLDGISLSSPAIDSVGNVWFVSWFELSSSPGNPSVGLFRAVYDPDSFSYCLELVLRSGNRFLGENSKTPWVITFMPLATSSGVVSSGGFFSGNVQETGFAGRSTSALPTRDSRTLGGLLLSVNLTYDRDGVGPLDLCPAAGGTGIDEPYAAVLYVGAVEPFGVIDPPGPPPVLGSGGNPGTGGGGGSGASNGFNVGKDKLLRPNPCED